MDGKRKRRPTNWAGFLTEDKQFDSFIPPASINSNPASTTTSAVATAAATIATNSSNNETVPQSSLNSSATTLGQAAGGWGANGAAAASEGAPPGHSTASSQIHTMYSTGNQPVAPSHHMSTRPRHNSSSSSSSNNNAAASGTGGCPSSVKKIPGVQNATRKALEWLQHGDMTLIELAQHLPKLSKARVEVVMEALRAAGLVSFVRKHALDASGHDHITEVYRFSAGCSAAEALEIGGGCPVTLGTISKRIKTTESELAGLKERIDVLKAEASKPAPSPQNVLEILRHFMKSDRSLDEDPFYTVAYKATTAAAAKAAKAAAAARAAAKAATDALVSERVAAATKKAADEAATVEANNAKLLAASVAAAAADNTKAANTAAAARSKQALHHQQAAAAGGSSNNVRSGPGSSSAPVVPGASVAKPESVVRTAEHRGASMGAAASAFVGALADGPVLGAPGGGGGSSCSSGVVDAGVVGAAARPVEEKPPEKR